MLIFRLKLSYFGTLRMHQTATFLSFFFPGEHAGSPLAKVSINIIRGLNTRLVCVIIYLGNKMIFIKTLMNADQIYSYLLKLKLNLRLGPNSSYKRTFYGYKKTFFDFVLENLVSSIAKTIIY